MLQDGFWVFGGDGTLSSDAINNSVGYSGRPREFRRIGLPCISYGLELILHLRQAEKKKKNESEANKNLVQSISLLVNLLSRKNEMKEKRKREKKRYIGGRTCYMCSTVKRWIGRRKTKIPERWPTKRHFARNLRQLLSTSTFAKSYKSNGPFLFFFFFSISYKAAAAAAAPKKECRLFLFSYLYIHLLNPIPGVFLAFSPRLIVSGYIPPPPSRLLLI